MRALLSKRPFLLVALCAAAGGCDRDPEEPSHSSAPAPTVPTTPAPTTPTTTSSPPTYRPPAPFLTLVWSEDGPDEDAAFGAAASAAGDVDRDGYADLLVGAPAAGPAAEGAAFLYRGSPAGPEEAATWTVQSVAEPAQYGGAVAGAGDVDGDGFDDFLVGATIESRGQTREGAAYLYRGASGGVSTTPAWTGESDHVASLYGAVSGAGDVDGDGFDDVLVGALAFNGVEGIGGRAYLYRGGPEGLAVAEAWSVVAGQDGAGLGTSVSGAGDVNGDGYDDVIVGAPYFDAPEGSEGRAQVFLGSADGLGLQAAWAVDGEQEAALLGQAVAGAGDVDGDGFDDVIVGAPGYSGVAPQEGRALVFRGGPDGLEAEASWTVSLGVPFAAVGTDVAPAGDVNVDGFDDVLVVAAEWFDGQDIGGAAWLYLGSPAGPEPFPVWSGRVAPLDGGYVTRARGAGDVDGDGADDVVLSYVPYDLFDPLRVGPGHAEVYLGGCAATDPDADADGTPDECDACPDLDDRAWDQDRDRWCGSGPGPWLDCDDADPRSFPGAPEVCDGRDNACAGEIPADEVDADGDGALACDGDYDDANPVLALAWEVVSDEDGAQFGGGVHGVGDVNGDGYADALIGAPGFSDGQGNEGKATLYFGSGTGLEVGSTWVVQGNSQFAQLGWAADGADLDGDGFAEILIGQLNFSHGETNEGGVRLYAGAAGGPSTTPTRALEIDLANAQFGSAVAEAGDVNGDGFADVLIGADSHSGGGAVLGYYGGVGGIGATEDWLVVSDQALAWLGAAVSSAGDVDGDGFGDVLVGEPSYGIGGGNAYVHLGSVTGLDTAAIWSGGGGDAYGASVSAGDLDGDGFSDIVVGAPGYDDAWEDQGRAYVYFGTSSGVEANAGWIGEGQGQYDQYGTSVAADGDPNGDGYDDLVVGAPGRHDLPYFDVGAATLYLGSPTGPGGPGWEGRETSDSSAFGISVGYAGDIDGDGFSDLLVGADGYSGAAFVGGKAVMYRGLGP